MRSRFLASLAVVIATASLGAAAFAAPTFVVNSFSDAATTASTADGICETAPGSGICTLRAAVQEANAIAGGGATIRIPAGVLSIEIPGAVAVGAATGAIDVGQGMTIEGDGPSSSIVDGNGLGAIFWVSALGPVTIRNLTLRNGGRAEHDADGVLVNYTDLLLDNVWVTDTDECVNYGAVSSQGNLTLRNCVVRNITCAQANGAGVAISSGTGRIEDSMILDNDAGDGEGGGIVSYGDTVIVRTLISGNVTNGNGGGVASGGGPDASLAIVNSVIAGNAAGARGGGLVAENDAPTHLVNSLVHANVADRFGLFAGTPDGAGGEFGGGIAVRNGGVVYLKNSVVAENRRGSPAGLFDECGPDATVSNDYDLLGHLGECTLTGVLDHVAQASQLIVFPPYEGGGGFAWMPDLIAPQIVDAIPPSFCTDQLGVPLAGDGRGYARGDSPCEIGPIENDAWRAVDPVVGVELLRNGGARGNEIGYATSGAVLDRTAMPPYWLTVYEMMQVLYGAPGFPTSADAPASSGSIFFAGGTAAVSTSTQALDVRAASAAIDGGALAYRVSGAFGGSASENDQATLTVTFFGASFELLGAAEIGGFDAAARGNATKLLRDSESGVVPVGTRYLDVTLEATRTAGSYNDGYADDLSLVLPEPGDVGAVAAIVALVGVRRRSRGRGL